MTTLRLRTQQLSWREIDDEVVAVDTRSSTYVSTNATGRLLWRGLAAGASRGQLVELIAERYGVPEERAGDDVDAFLAELRARDLLEE
jgi:hypothetical protein